MPKTILVTGASGNAGSDVVVALAKAGYRVRAGSRNPSALPKVKGATPVYLSYDDGPSFRGAMEGADGVFLVAPPMDMAAPEKLRPFIQTAREAGISHIVFLSAFGANSNENSPLRQVELSLIESGVGYTILRPNFFMENFSGGFLAGMIQQTGSIYLAADTGKTSFISTKDIARVTLAAFEQRLVGKEFDLTGPEALDHEKVAALISESTGAEVTYTPLPEEDMLNQARDNGMPEGSVQYMGILYGAVRAGYTAPITRTVEEVTGSPPLDFSSFVKHNASAWKAAH